MKFAAIATRFAGVRTDAEAPARLQHVANEFCWCDPVLEAGEDGAETVVHREVVWN